MCGLIGYSGNDFVDEGEIKTLLLDAQIRGPHSTGVFGKQLFKFAGTAKDAVEQPPFKSAVKNTKIVVGHTRYGTMGANNKENAHPFKIGDGENRVYGTHNGMIPKQAYKSVLENFKIEDPGVDSLAIFNILHKYNYDINVLKDIVGTMALAFTDREYLFLYRRSNKPLFTGRMDIESDGDLLKGLFYSSRAEGLKDIGCTNIRPLPTDLLHIYKEGELLGVRQVPKCTISDHIRLDAGATNWHSAVPDRLLNSRDDLKLLSSWQSRNPQSRSNTGSTNSRASASYPNGTQSPIGFKSTQGNLTNLETISNMVRNSIEADSLRIEDTAFMSNFSVFDDGDYFQSCYMIIKLLDSRSGENKTDYPLPFFYMGLESDTDQLNYPDCHGITTHSGHTALKLMPKQLNHDLKLIMYAPLEGTTVAYRATINHKELMNGRVLEVTLQIPFYEDKEKEEADGETPNDKAIGAREEYTNVLPWTDEAESNVPHSGANRNPKTIALERSKGNVYSMGGGLQRDSDKLHIVPKSSIVDAETSMQADCELQRDDFETEEQWENYLESYYSRINEMEYSQSLKTDIKECKLLNPPVQPSEEEVPFVNNCVILTQNQYKAYACLYNMELLLEDAGEMKRTKMIEDPTTHVEENIWVSLCIQKYPGRYLKKENKELFPETEDFIDTMVKPAKKIDAAEATFINLSDRLEQFEDLLCRAREAQDVGASEHTKDEALSSIYSYIQTMYSELREYTAEVKTLALEQGATFIKQ